MMKSPAIPTSNAGMCWLQGGGDNLGMALQLVDCWGESLKRPTKAVPVPDGLCSSGDGF